MPEQFIISTNEIMGWSALIVAVGVAIGWLAKGVRPLLKPLKRPIEEIKGDLGEIDKRSKVCADMFANDNRRLDRHERQLAEQNRRLDALSDDVKQLLQNDLLTLAHIETGNNTGDIATRRKELETYIVRNR